MIFNDNDRDRYKPNNDSDNDAGISEYEVEEIAHKLSLKFNDTANSYKPFYCRLARSVPQARIWQMAETAERNANKSAGGYFMTIGMREMGTPPRKNKNDT